MECAAGTFWNTTEAAQTPQTTFRLTDVLPAMIIHLAEKFLGALEQRFPSEGERQHSITLENGELTANIWVRRGAAWEQWPVKFDPEDRALSPEALAESCLQAVQQQLQQEDFDYD